MILKIPSYTNRVGDNYANNLSGFTLLELLAVLGIVAILLAIAIPSYRHSVERGNRITVRSELTGISERLSKLALKSPTGQLPSDGALDKYPWSSGKGGEYSYSVKVVDNGFGYWIVAMPNPAGAMKGDGAQALSHTGVGCWHRLNDNPSVNEPCNKEGDEPW